ncbi:MAG: hypothetical protein QG552_3437 [Thermodesulfobacteriota bacterium]|nr:hypothetical protein [Thermodesulfobacteriota bacterium]
MASFIFRIPIPMRSTLCRRKKRSIPPLLSTRDQAKPAGDDYCSQGLAVSIYGLFEERTAVGRSSHGVRYLARSDHDSSG